MCAKFKLHRKLCCHVGEIWPSVSLARSESCKKVLRDFKDLDIKNGSSFLDHLNSMCISSVAMSQCMTRSLRPFGSIE